MKKNLLWMMAAILVCGLTAEVLMACSDDDDSRLSEEKGILEVDELRALVLDAKGQIAFDFVETNGMYRIGLESLEDARNLTALYVGEGFTGQPYTRTLAGNKGTVQVRMGDNGVFYKVHFAVTGIPSFTLNLVDGSNGGNAFDIYHKCSVCGFSWMSTLNRCPREGNSTYHPQK